MKKRNCGQDCVTLEQALWLACTAAGAGILICLLLCNTVMSCLIAGVLIILGICRLRK